MKKAVFLDRDGTICKDVSYCSRVEDFELLATVPQGIQLLKENGFGIVVITNQSGIARGYFTEDALSQIHQKMKHDLVKYNTEVDAIYFCPHHPDDGCECRKPKPKLLLRAAEELGISLQLSYMIGDHQKDIEAGGAAGCRTIFVTTGPNKEFSWEQNKAPDFIADSLYEAAKWIIEDTKSRTK